MADPGTLLQTDSEGENDLLLETDSDEAEPGPASDQESVGEILYETDSDCAGEAPLSKRRKYSERKRSEPLKFLDKQVCKHAHARLYGIGAGALQRLREGKSAFSMQQNRLEEPKHKVLGVSLVRDCSNRKWPNVWAFFWLLYMSCAEVMPTKFVMPRQGGFESHISSDPDFQERYTRAFMANLERYSGCEPAFWL